MATHHSAEDKNKIRKLDRTEMLEYFSRELMEEINPYEASERQEVQLVLAEAEVRSAIQKDLYPPYDESVKNINAKHLYPLGEDDESDEDGEDGQTKKKYELTRENYERWIGEQKQALINALLADGQTAEKNAQLWEGHRDLLQVKQLNALSHIELIELYLYPPFFYTECKDKSDRALFLTNRAYELSNVTGKSQYDILKAGNRYHSYKNALRSKEMIDRVGVSVDEVVSYHLAKNLSEKEAEKTSIKLKNFLGGRKIQEYLQKGTFKNLSGDVQEHIEKIWAKKDEILDGRVKGFERFREQIRSNLIAMSTSAEDEINTYVGQIPDIADDTSKTLLSILDKAHSVYVSNGALQEKVELFKKVDFNEQNQKSLEEWDIGGLIELTALSTQEEKQWKEAINSMLSTEDQESFRTIGGGEKKYLQLFEEWLDPNKSITDDQKDTCKGIAAELGVEEIGNDDKKREVIAKFRKYIAIKELQRLYKERVIVSEDGDAHIKKWEELITENMNSLKERRTFVVSNYLEDLYQGYKKEEARLKLELPEDRDDIQKEKKRYEKIVAEYKDIQKKRKTAEALLTTIKNPTISLGNMEALFNEIEESGDLQDLLNEEQKDEIVKLVKKEVGNINEHGEIEGTIIGVADMHTEAMLNKQRSDKKDLENLIFDACDSNDPDVQGEWDPENPGEYKWDSKNPRMKLRSVDHAEEVLNRLLGTKNEKERVSLKPGAWFYLKTEKKNVSKDTQKRMDEAQQSHFEVLVKIKENIGTESVIFEGQENPVNLKHLMACILATEDSNKYSLGRVDKKTEVKFAYDGANDPEEINKLENLEKKLGVRSGDDDSPQPKLEKGTLITYEGIPFTNTPLGEIRRIDKDSTPPKVHFKNFSMEFAELYAFSKNFKAINVVPQAEAKKTDSVEWQGKNSESWFTFTSLAAGFELLKNVGENLKKRLEEKDKLTQLELQMKYLEGIYGTLKWKIQYDKIVDEYRDMQTKEAKYHTDSLNNIPYDNDDDVYDELCNDFGIVRGRMRVVSKLDMGKYRDRAKIQGWITFLLERYGTLYPFDEMKDWEDGKFWMSVFDSSKTRQSSAVSNAINQKGPNAGQDEFWQLQQLVKGNVYFGNPFAKSLEDSKSTGEKKSEEKAKEYYSTRVVTPEVAGKVVDAVRNQRWPLALSMFEQYCKKEFSAEHMFNMFMYFFDSICYWDGNEYNSRLTYDALQDFAKKIALSFPAPYFWVFRRKNTFQQFAKLIYDKDYIKQNFGWTGSDPDKMKGLNTRSAQESAKWEFEEPWGIPKPKVDKRITDDSKQLWKAFTATGNFDLLAMADKEKDKDIHTFFNEPGDGVIAQVTELAGKFGDKLGKTDHNVWGRSAYLMMTHRVWKDILRLDSSSEGWEREEMKVYFAGILSSIKELKDADIPKDAKDRLMKKFASTVYNKFYANFSWTESAYREGDYKDKPSAPRDFIHNQYYKQLVNLGAGYEEAYEAYREERKEEGEIVSKKWTHYIVPKNSPDKQRDARPIEISEANVQNKAKLSEAYELIKSEDWYALNGKSSTRSRVADVLREDNSFDLLKDL